MADVTDLLEQIVERLDTLISAVEKIRTENFRDRYLGRERLREIHNILFNFEKLNFIL